MTIVIPFCHKDSDQALRLIAWIVRLGGLPPEVRVLLAVSQRGTRDNAGRKAIDAGRTMLNAELFVPHDENERGWPHSASHLFQRTLAHVQDDLFWLEPDCVPIGPGWFDALLAEWVSAGKVFVGGYVSPSNPTVRDHLTGCSFYGAAWRKATPALCTNRRGPINSGAWDLDFADLILPHAGFTALIQHDWDRFNKSYQPRASDLRLGVRLFHQCKTGELMAELDPNFLQWRLTQPQLHPIACDRMSRHFLTKNVSKPVRVGGKPIPFEPVLYFAASASFWGVRAAADDAEASALTELAASGVISALSPEEFADYLEKKNGTTDSPSLKPLSVINPPSGPVAIQTKVANLVDAAPVKPAVEVESTPQVETLDEALSPQPVPEQRESTPRKTARRK